MFAMAKHVSSHLTKSDDDGDGGGGGGGSAKKRPRASKAAAAGGDKPKREQPKQKLSPALAAIVGAGTMARPQVARAQSASHARARGDSGSSGHGGRRSSLVARRSSEI